MPDNARFRRLTFPLNFGGVSLFSVRQSMRLQRRLSPTLVGFSPRALAVLWRGVPKKLCWQFEAGWRKIAEHGLFKDPARNWAGIGAAAPGSIRSRVLRRLLSSSLPSQ